MDFDLTKFNFNLFNFNIFEIIFQIVLNLTTNISNYNSFHIIFNSTVINMIYIGFLYVKCLKLNKKKDFQINLNGINCQNNQNKNNQNKNKNRKNEKVEKVENIFRNGISNSEFVNKISVNELKIIDNFL